MDRLIDLLWCMAAKLFVPPAPPTLPSLGPAAKLVGVQAAAQAIVAKAVAGAYFLGARDGAMVGAAAGMILGALAARALGRGRPHA